MFTSKLETDRELTIGEIELVLAADIRRTYPRPIARLFYTHRRKFLKFYKAHWEVAYFFRKMRYLLHLGLFCLSIVPMFFKELCAQILILIVVFVANILHVDLSK